MRNDNGDKNKTFFCEFGLDVEISIGSIDQNKKECHILVLSEL